MAYAGRGFTGCAVQRPTPKTLWGLFGKKGKGLVTLLSTMAGKHGSKAQGTEVPRERLVEALKKESRMATTEDFVRKEIVREMGAS